MRANICGEALGDSIGKVGADMPGVDRTWAELHNQG